MILSGVVEWFLSSPTVLETLFFVGVLVALIMSAIGYATREG